MPTYEYRCKQCGHEFEMFQSMTADPVSKCSQCEGIVERVISGGTGLIFKGSGFYITDYRNGAKSAASGESTSTSKKETSSEKAEKKNGESKTKTTEKKPDKADGKK